MKDTNIQGYMTETMVKAEGDKDYLLDDPNEAYENIFGTDRNPGDYDYLQWKKHVFQKNSVRRQLWKRFWIWTDINKIQTNKLKISPERK